MEKSIRERELAQRADLTSILNEHLINLSDLIDELKNNDQEDVAAKIISTVCFLHSLQVMLFVDTSKALDMPRDMIECGWDNMAKSLDECGQEYIKEVFEGKQSDE